MQIDHPQGKCQHEGCGCEVEAGNQYCSEFCRQAAEQPDVDELEVHGGNCGCGHPECIEQ